MVMGVVIRLAGTELGNEDLVKTIGPETVTKQLLASACTHFLH